MDVVISHLLDERIQILVDNVGLTQFERHSLHASHLHARQHLVRIAVFDGPRLPDINPFSDVKIHWVYHSFYLMRRTTQPLRPVGAGKCNLFSSIRIA